MLSGLGVCNFVCGHQAASLKDKWGLGYKPSYNRSKSISTAAAGRPPLKRMERQRYWTEVR